MTFTARDARFQQQQWATERGVPFDGRGYTPSLEDNLFVPLCDDSRREFEAGDGAELGHKMRALHSSSALACNVFEHWRARDKTPLAQALDLSSAIESVAFEQKMRTGLPGNPPNLDVVLRLADGSMRAIESKFLEPYGGRHAAGFTSKYFESPAGEWLQHGFVNCQELAQGLQSGEVAFRWLNAEQLLKHVLGLARKPLPWGLMYLWYSPSDEAAIEHEAEARRFAEVASCDGVWFRSMTYQALYSNLQSACPEERDYLDYLGTRYFARSG